LATNVVTGQIVNCDGSEFTGSGVAGGTTDYLAEGETIYVATCAGCHGAAGGGGAGPALNGVLNTFGSCADHAHWVQVGSGGFQAAGETTYGDTNKQIKGGMPPHPGLSDEQLASVVSFERVRFGGAEVEQTFTDCGLAEAAPPADGVSTTLAPGS
jgi:mono/diheme cytochrome c family protein